MQLAPGDPDDPPAFSLEGAVTRPIALEGAGRGMHGVTIKLDDDPLSAPDAVALDPSPLQPDARVHLGRWQAGALQEPEKPPLQLAAGHGDADASVPKRGFDHTDAPAARVACDEIIE